MNKLKLILTLGLMLVVLFAQVGSAAAAPQTQTPTPITGTIQSITLETDANGVTTVLVTLVDSQNVTQTVRISVDTAVALGLVTLDSITNEPVVVDAQIGQPVTIDPTTVIPDPTTEEPVHPISALLAAFFGEDASIVDAFHNDGFGFGVIAQALWMSQNLNGDGSLAGEILQAKKSGDYSAFILPDGTVATNWGQFRKAVLDKKNNLGIVVSGHGQNPNGLSAQSEHGNGNNKGNGKGNGKGHGHNKP
jgi:hypothetical protein